MARSDSHLCDRLEKLAEKAVLAAEALEQAVGDAGLTEIAFALTRTTALRSEADGLVQEALALLNPSRAMPLSPEQTRALARALHGVFDAIAWGLEQMHGDPSQISVPNGLATATILRRSVEQVRLAVSGLRDPSAWMGVLQSCAHIRALRREGALLMSNAPSECLVCASMGDGLDRCVEAADALESAFGVAPGQPMT